MKIKTIVSAALVINLCCVMLMAVDTYVSKTGDDANSGLDWATAKATIEAAANVAGAGDTINVGTGLWLRTSTFDYNSGTYKDKNLVGVSPVETIFRVTENVKFVDRLETQTMNPLFANFKIEDNGVPVTSFDQCAFGFGDGGNNMSVRLSNLWVVGVYDGDQVNGIDGTDGNRNGSAIFLRGYGAGGYYNGTMSISYCLFEKWGRVFAFNDYSSDSGFNTTVFERCTIVNCADTGAGYVDGSTIWFRGTGLNRWFSFTKCVMSDCGIDSNCDGGTWGVRAIVDHQAETPVALDNNLFYTNSLANGRTYYESVDFYTGIEGDVKTTKPIYTTAGGKKYTLVKSGPTVDRGWSTIPEPGILTALLFVAVGFVLKRM